MSRSTQARNTSAFPGARISSLKRAMVISVALQSRMVPRDRLADLEIDIAPYIEVHVANGTLERLQLLDRGIDAQLGMLREIPATRAGAEDREKNRAEPLVAKL